MFDLAFEQQLMIESFLNINGKKEHRDYPILQYPAHHQREVGFFETVNMYMYIGSNGNAHASPFCQTKLGNCIEESINNTIENSKRKGALPAKKVKWVYTIHNNRISNEYCYTIFPL